MFTDTNKCLYNLVAEANSNFTQINQKRKKLKDGSEWWHHPSNDNFSCDKSRQFYYVYQSTGLELANIYGDNWRIYNYNNLTNYAFEN